MYWKRVEPRRRGASNREESHFTEKGDVAFPRILRGKEAPSGFVETGN